MSGIVDASDAALHLWEGLLSWHEHALHAVQADR